MTDTNENSPSEPQTPAEATLLIRAGSTRTGFHETAEAIFPTSGYVYDSAAEAEAAFAGEVIFSQVPLTRAKRSFDPSLR